MSDVYCGELSTGAYVIRNKETSTVLHMGHANADEVGSGVLAYKQDENLYKDQQIWWIEPLACFGSEDTEPEKGLVYSITNPASGRSLGAPTGDGITPKTKDKSDTFLTIWPVLGNLCTWYHHGLPWQRWRLRKVVDEDGGVSYNIITFYNDKVVDIAGEVSDSGSLLHMQEYTSGCKRHCWEFVIPVIAFPPGWVHIQNVGTRDLLRHNYAYNSPMLLPPTDAPRESQYREDWEFQWTLAHSKCFDPSTTEERNSWCIINRLTRARLIPLFGNIRNENDYANRFNNVTWRLELDSSRNWRITNLSTSCLLEQTNVPFNGGTAVVCSGRKIIQNGGSQSWILKYTLPTATEN